MRKEKNKMFLDLHIIQNFAPSNLNRDDANTPKDCEFGGYRRARISSQCIKRSVRRHPSFIDSVKRGGGDVGLRTKRLKGRLAEIFVNEYKKTTDEAENVAQAVIEILGLKLKDEEKTEYLLYLGESEAAELAKLAIPAWKSLQATETGKGKKKKDSESSKLADEFRSVLSKNRKEAKSYAADIALFGRMIADNKNMSVDAACQVAHAVSTHKVEMETDYFTAIDDLLPNEETGSDMIGVVEFNSSCFYRYSNINVAKLRENLGHNDDLLEATILGYIEATVKAIPTGKQNSMAAQNPAGYARVILRKDGFPWSLANAFQTPIKASGEGCIEERSINALEAYYDRLKGAYGGDGIIYDASFNIFRPDGGSLSKMLNQLKTALDGEGGK
jgi:CRISPR system Cascade subunit CasC